MMKMREEYKKSNNNMLANSMDMMRVICCIIIIMHHWTQFCISIFPEIPYKDIIISITTLKNASVYQFFILSGIGLSLSFDRNKIKEYYLKRVKKIILPYWILLIASSTVIVLVQKINIGSMFKVLIPYFFFVNNYFPESRHYISSLWFMAVIIQFYTIYPFLNMLFKKIGIILAFISIIIINYLYLYLLLSIGIENNRANSSIFNYISIFAVGIAVGIIIKNNTDINRILKSNITLAVGILIFLMTWAMKKYGLGDYNDLLTAVAYFIILNSIIYKVIERTKPIIINKITMLSPYTFFAYIIHVPIIEYFLRPLFMSNNLLIVNYPLILLSGFFLVVSIFIISLLIFKPVNNLSYAISELIIAHSERIR